MVGLEVSGVRKSLGGTPVLHGVSLRVPAGARKKATVIMSRGSRASITENPPENRWPT